MGMPEAEITHAVDVSAHLAAKRESLRCHRSQITDTSFFLEMPDEAFAAGVRHGVVHQEGRRAGSAPRVAVRMTRLYLVRHGRAAAGWDTDPDPGLDEIGRGQAQAVAAPACAARPDAGRHQPAAALPARLRRRSPTRGGRGARSSRPSPRSRRRRVSRWRTGSTGCGARWRGTMERPRRSLRRIPRRGGRRRSRPCAANGGVQPLRRDQRGHRRRRSATIGWSFAASTTARSRSSTSSTGVLQLVESGHEADTLIR